MVAEAMRLCSSAEAHRRLSQIIDAASIPAALAAIAAAVALTDLAPVLLVDAGPPQAIAVAAAPILRGLHQRLQICCRMREVAARSGETSRRAHDADRAYAGYQKNHTYC